MVSFFQKKYIKIPLIILIIFSISFRFFPPPKESEAIEIIERPKIDYLDICEPKVPFYDEPLQTDELQEACYLLKKIQDRAAQEIDIARLMFELTDPLTECNPIIGEEPPFVTTGNCRTACAWGLPEFEIGIDITMLIICFFYPEACAGEVAEVKKVLDLINKILDLLDLIDQLRLIINIVQDLTTLYQDAVDLYQKIEDLLTLLPDIDLSELEEFYQTLMDLMLIKYDIQREINDIEGKIYQMENTIGHFSEGQLKGIYRLVNEIGDIFANKILAPNQSPGEGFVTETLEEMKQAAENDEIKNLIDKIIAENDAIQQILHQFYQKEGEKVSFAIIGMLDVVCQTKAKISAILSYLAELENKNPSNPVKSGINAIKPIFQELSDKIAILESGQIQHVESCEGRGDGESCGDFRWCLGERCMEYYWQKTGTKKGWCCSGNRTQCAPEQYGNEREGGSKGEYGGIWRYVNCGVPFCIFTRVGYFQCERREIVQEEEPWPPEEVCRLRDRFHLLQELDNIIALLENISKMVNRVDIDLEASNEQIESDCQRIKQAFDYVKTKIDGIKPELIEFGVPEADIKEAKAEIDEMKPKIDELEETALRAMGIINLLKAIKLIKEIIDAVEQFIEDLKKLRDDVAAYNELQAREKLKELPEYEATVSFQVGDFWDMIKCLPAKGIYGKYTAESSEEIPCPTVASSTKYVGGRVCPDLQVPFNQLSGAFASIVFNLNKIRDIERAGNPEVAPVTSKALQIWEKALYLEAWALFLRYMTDKCVCGRSYCRLTFGISGISLTCLDPLLNVYCWLAWTFGRKLIDSTADELEKVNSE